MLEADPTDLCSARGRRRSAGRSGGKKSRGPTAGRPAADGWAVKVVLAEGGATRSTW